MAPAALASARWAHTDGELVVVSEAANRGCPARGELSTARVSESEHFSVFTLDGGSIVVLHRLEAGEMDNDIAEFVAGELVRPGHVPIPNAFERCFAGVVLSSAERPEEAWRMFYENTLAKLERGASESRMDDFAPISVFGRIYEHARSLVAGSSVLDVGTCFGFFPMLLRRKDPRLAITALDLSKPMVELAANHAGDVSFVCGDALNLPFADDSFDTAVSLHVLEHLPPESAARTLREMRRVARKRVVVAVPLEEEPDPAYGHVQSFDRASFTRLTEADGWRRAFEEYLGGWVVLDATPGRMGGIRVDYNAMRGLRCGRVFV